MRTSPGLTRHCGVSFRLGVLTAVEFVFRALAWPSRLAAWKAIWPIPRGTVAPLASRLDELGQAKPSSVTEH